MEKEEYENAFGKESNMTSEQKKERLIDRIAIIGGIIAFVIGVIILITYF
jgi:uncharacterized membrane protein